MKIIIDARLYGLEHAGLGRYTLNLVDQLTKLDANNEYILLLRKKYFNKLKLPHNFKKVLADFRHYTLSEQIRLPIILHKEKPDLVHFPHFNLPLLYFGRYVVTIHDLLMHKYIGGAVTTLPFPFYQLRRIGYDLAFKKAVKGSKAILVPTEYVKEDIQKYYDVGEDKIVVTKEGVPFFGKMRSKVNKESVLRKYNICKPFFIYVGNVYPHKNIDKAIDAVLELNKQSSRSVSFIIACSRSVFSKRLIETVEIKNAADYVNYIGFIEESDLPVLLSEALAFVYPSLEEGFGLQGLEVMAAGGLVIASDIPVFREIYKDNVLYFDPRSTKSIIKVMKSVMKIKSKKKEQIIKLSQEYIKRYSWKRMVERTLTVYKQSTSN